jgi:excisionase family DNA binding protein
MPPREELLTKSEAQQFLRISRPTMQRLMRNKAFPYIRLERKILFRRSEIEKFLESKTVSK